VRNLGARVAEGPARAEGPAAEPAALELDGCALSAAAESESTLALGLSTGVGLLVGRIRVVAASAAGVGERLAGDSRLSRALTSGSVQGEGGAESCSFQSTSDFGGDSTFALFLGGLEEDESPEPAALRFCTTDGLGRREGATDGASRFAELDGSSFASSLGGPASRACRLACLAAPRSMCLSLAPGECEGPIDRPLD
jgi:hypothetical protein